MSDETIPELAALTDRQRKFVIAIVTEGLNQTRAAAAAGFSGDAATLRSTAHRLMRDERIAAAIVAVGRVHMRFGTGCAINTLIEICQPGYPPADRTRAAKALLDRGGLPAMSEKHITFTHVLSRDDQIKSIVKLCEELGLDPHVYLGRAAIVVDADFKEITPAALPAPRDEWAIPPGEYHEE